MNDRGTEALSPVPLPIGPGSIIGPGYAVTASQPCQLRRSRAAAIIAALCLVLGACASQPQTVIVHQLTAPPIQAGLRTCQAEPMMPSRTASDVSYAQWFAAAVLSGRDCRNVLGKLNAVLDAFAASLKDQGK